MIQRFNSALDVAPHFHSLFLDGVYTFPPGRKPVFHPVPSPTDDDIAAVSAAAFRRVERQLHGRELAAAQSDFVESAPVLAAMTEASARGVIVTGPRRGCRVLRVRGLAADIDAFVMGRLCAQVEGYNLQAATRIAANDREALERMGRYLARPPVATNRLSQLEDGRLELRLKRPWRDGTTAFRFTAHELIERLVAIVPRPRSHLARYHGVLAPAFAARSEIVPSSPDETAATSRPQAPPGAEAPKRPGGFPWASLIWRVFLEDVLACARCAGRMAIVAAVTSRAGVARILEHLRLPTEAPAFHAARPPPQAELPLDVILVFQADPPASDDVGVWLRFYWSQYQADFKPFNAAALATDLEARFVEPLRKAQLLFDRHAKLTRLATFVSPEEMTSDPTFVMNTSLPDVPVTRTATAWRMCGDRQYDVCTAPVRLELRSGEAVWFLPKPQPVCWGQAYDYQRGELDTMPALYRAYDRDSAGEGMTKYDNQAMIRKSVDSHNAAVAPNGVPLPRLCRAELFAGGAGPSQGPALNDQ